MTTTKMAHTMSPSNSPTDEPTDGPIGMAHRTAPTDAARDPKRRRPYQHPPRTSPGPSSSSLDALCFSCPLPDCNESSTLCPRRRARHDRRERRNRHDRAHSTTPPKETHR